MELRVLQYFLAVAREGNITKAANLLHVTQPTLSRQLMQLEDELGVTLFQRGRQRISLTNEGLLLKRRAQEIVELTRKTEAELGADSETISGEIAIGCGETQNMACLVQEMMKFQTQHPDVRYTFYTAVADEVCEQLENGTLDFGLLMEPVEISPYHYIRMPVREHWCALMRADDALARKEAIRVDDLAGQPLIIARRESVRNELENWFGERYADMRFVAACNLSYSNRCIMVENGMGIALVHEFSSLSENLCLRPLSPSMENRCVLVWKKRTAYTPAVSRFIEQLKHAFQAFSK